MNLCIGEFINCHFLLCELLFKILLKLNAGEKRCKQNIENQIGKNIFLVDGIIF